MFSLATAYKANREGRGTMLVLCSLLIISHLFHPWIQTKTKFSATLVEREGECWSAQNFVKRKKKSEVISFHPLSCHFIVHSVEVCSSYTSLLKTHTLEMDLIFHDVSLKVVFRSKDYFNQKLLIGLRSIMSGLKEIDPFTVKALERISKSFFNPCDLC